MNLANKHLSIVLFSHTAGLDGAGRSLLDLAKGFARSGVVCNVVIPYEGPLKTALLDIGSGVIIAPVILGSKWYFVSTMGKNENQYMTSQQLEAIKALANQISFLYPDYIISQTIVSPWGAICAEVLNIPHALSAREYGVLDHNFLFNFGFKDSMDAFYKTSDVLLCISEDVKKELFGDDILNKCNVIYSGIELENDVFKTHEDVDLNVYFPDVIGPIICMPATLQPGKGQLDLVNAIITLRKKNIAIRCILIGHTIDYDYAEQVYELTSNSGFAENFYYLPFKNNIYSILKQVDCVVSCSKREALGRTLIEASLLEKPIIYTRRGGPIEVFIDTVHGLAYEPGDHEQLAACILRTIEEPEEAIQRVNNAKALCEQQFNIESYSQRALEKIKSNCSKKKRRRSNAKPVIRLLTNGGKSLFEPLAWRPKIYWKGPGQDFSEERVIFSDPICFGYISLELEISSDSCYSLRFDPVEYPPVAIDLFSTVAFDINNRQLGSEEIDVSLALNGKASGQQWIFYNEDPQIVINFSRPIRSIKINCFVNEISKEKMMLILAERDAQLAERDAQLAERAAQLAERAAQLAERAAQLAERAAQLAERDAQLAEIQNSKAWRFAIFLRQIRIRFFPPGSLWTEIIKKFFRSFLSLATGVKSIWSKK
jgi:glycosyltransferase involved in cell wall biosynthesis